MGSDVRDLLELPAAGKSERKDISGDHGRKFRRRIDGVNEQLRVVAARGNRDELTPLEALRERLYQGYQKTLAKYDVDDPDQLERDLQRLVDAATGVERKATGVASQVTADQEAWLAAEGDFDAAMVRIGELETDHHEKAPSLRKLGDAIRDRANDRKYREALTAWESLEPKLETLYAEHQEQKAAEEAAADEAADAPREGLTVVIQDLQSGDPIEGVQLTIGDQTDSSSSLGLATVELPVGKHKYEASSEQFEAATGEVEIVAGDNPELVIELAQKDLPREGLTILVKDSETGEVVEGAEVAVGDQTDQTSQRGLATVELPAGKHVYTIEAPGFYGVEGEVEVIEGDNPELVVEVESDFNMETDTAHLEVVVLDSDGNPVADSLVRGESTSGGVELGHTDESGVAQLDLVESEFAGGVTVWASKDRQVWQKTAVAESSLKLGETHRVELKSSAPGEFGAAEVQVTLKSSREGIAMCMVQLTPFKVPMSRCDDQGRTTIEGIPPGTYKITAIDLNRDVSQNTVETEIVIVADETTSVALEFDNAQTGGDGEADETTSGGGQAGGAAADDDNSIDDSATSERDDEDFDEEAYERESAHVQVTVLDDQGRGVDGALIRITGKSAGIRLDHTDENGVARTSFSAYIDEEYLVTAAVGKTAWKAQTIKAGALKLGETVAITLAKTEQAEVGAVEVQVVREGTDQGFANCYVQLQPFAVPVSHSDEQGISRFENVPVGSYQVIAMDIAGSEGDPPKIETGVEVTADNTSKIKLAIPSSPAANDDDDEEFDEEAYEREMAHLEVKVLDGQGQPVDGALVRMEGKSAGFRLSHTNEQGVARESMSAYIEEALTVTASLGKTAWKSVQVQAGSLQLGQTTSIQLTETETMEVGAIEAEVVRKETGEVMTRCYVQLKPFAVPVQFSDEQGISRFENVPIGKYKVIAIDTNPELDDTPTAEAEVEVTADATEHVILEVPELAAVAK